jgi:acetyl-CoA synthetase
MNQHPVYPIPPLFEDTAWINQEDYRRLYQASLNDPEEFWREQGQRLDWVVPYTKIKDVSFDPSNVFIRWFYDGKLNVAANCLDRHLKARGQDTAIIWESDDGTEHKIITYQALFEEVCQFSNVLKSLGVGKGDRVVIYLPMIPEAAVAMLACARIGAVHSVVFGGFSPESLAGRIGDCGAKLVITADEGLRGGKIVLLKKNTDEALLPSKVTTVEKVIVVKRTGGEITWNASRDLWYHHLTPPSSKDCPAETMDAEDPLFILYTSGSTGSPKGVLHTTGGYLVYASMTHQYIFDYKQGDIYWCTADVGWITGHSYVIYGPLANGATTLMFEGTPQYPDSARLWQIIDKHQVNIFYTAPTTIRTLMAEGDEAVKSCERTSLRLLGTVGEPINPEAWEWYYQVIGDSKCPIVDTWWQTETGGILITPLPGATPLKPGSATQPFFGIHPALLNHAGEVLEGVHEGNLVILDSWPGQMRTLYNNHEHFVETYFKPFPGMYTTGDGARRDQDGDYWITGRVDDVINVAGHRIGTAEIESALTSHPKVAEAAVVGFPHATKGQGIYAYVTLNIGENANQDLSQELIRHVRKDIGPIVTPDILQWAPGLPKTRSGKIMRRILRKIAAQEYNELGDISTLADPTVVKDLILNSQRLLDDK